MGFLDGNGLATLWEKIKERASSKNVFTNAPTGDDALQENGGTAGNYKFLNHISGGEVKSVHQIIGEGGITISSSAPNTSIIDNVLIISSSCVACGTFSHSDSTTTINTGFTETPKLFKLYYTTDGSTVNLLAECRPELDTPFDCIFSGNLPVYEITFDGGVATINAHTSTGLTMMWEAYI